VSSLKLTEEEQKTLFNILLSSPDGSFKRHENVRFTEISATAFSAIPYGSQKVFSIKPELMVYIEPADRAVIKEDLWQAQVSAQEYLMSGGTATPPLSARSRNTIETAQRTYSDANRPAAAPVSARSTLLGQAFPPVRLMGASGDPFTLEELRGGRPVVLVVLRGFPGFVCPHCTAQTAALINALPSFEERGARVAMVYPGEASTVPTFLKAMKEFREGKGVPIPILFDAELELVRALGIRGEFAKPTTAIVDGNGVLRYLYVGQSFNDRPSVGTLLAALSSVNASQANPSAAASR